MLLDVAAVSAGYAGVDVIRAVSCAVGGGEVVAIIGSNGAGKTTLLRTISGLLAPTSGRVRFRGRDLHGVPAHRRARAGIAYVPADRHLFGDMSVLDNLTLGAYPSRPDGAQLDVVLRLFPALAQRRTQPASTMSGGEQQMLAVGRALMSRPALLVLDEPTTGLAPAVAAAAYAALDVLRADGMSILVAEQHVPLALGLADRGYVLEDGCIQLEGTATALRDDPAVRRAYLGVG